MIYKIGQNICLWEVNPEPVATNVIQVVREVMVRITDIRMNVPGEFSKKPAGTGFKGTGDDGKEYKKHWDFYPESQHEDYKTQWSVRDDGTVDKFPFWAPHESAPFHSGIMSMNISHNIGLKIVDKDSNPIEPKGDLEKCVEHGIFRYPGMKCIQCSLAELRKIPIPLS